MPDSASKSEAALALESELAAIYAFYLALAPDLDPDSGLGGKLLFAGSLDPTGARLVRAANIAGAASLSATADVSAQKHSIREGVVDFLVNSLDEALRILKNEIRKHQAVSVCVAASADLILQQMIERGVQPDIVPAESDLDLSAFLAHGAHPIEPHPLPPDLVFVVFPEPATDFDARVLAALPAEDHATRRWLRLSSRYLGPNARRMRSLACDPATAASLTAAKP
jgi:hypothetical protein